MKKVVLTFGGIAGIIVVGLMYLSMPFHKQLQDMGLGEVVGYTTMLLAFSSIFLGIKSLRDNYDGGTISFKRAFLAGLYITLIASAIYAIGWEIYFQATGGNFLEEYGAAQIEKMRTGGATEAKIQAFQAEMQMWTGYYKNPIFRFGLTIMEILPVGLLVSLISAAILRRKDVQQTATA